MEILLYYNRIVEKFEKYANYSIYNNNYVFAKKMITEFY